MTPLPIYRCERCSYWIPRDLGDASLHAPDCPYCSKSDEYRYVTQPAPMWPAFRVPSSHATRKKGRRALAQRPRSAVPTRTN